jgi:hypothetical protein
MMTNFSNFGPELDRVDKNVKAILALVQTLTTQGTQIMTVLDDLKAADALTQAAIAAAVTLIESLHTGVGSVSDADVEAVVSDLKAAAGSLSAAAPQP